jgi:hypothetical protein
MLTIAPPMQFHSKSEEIFEQRHDMDTKTTLSVDFVLELLEIITAYYVMM